MSTIKVYIGANFFPGVNIHFTNRETQILAILDHRRGSIVSVETFCSEIWGDESHSCYSSLRVHISNIRKKLKYYKMDNLIQSSRNKGYVLKYDATQPIR